MGTAFKLLSKSGYAKLYKRTKVNGKRRPTVDYVVRFDWWASSHIKMLDYKWDGGEFTFKRRLDAEQMITTAILKLGAGR